MAKFLYRIGQWSARRAGRVITAWLVLLGLAVSAFLVFGGTLEDQFSIPGTETERVNAELEQELDASATGASTVVFHTEDGSEFSEAQREQIGAALDEVAEFEDVSEVVDPFVAQAEREQDEAELADGREQIEENHEELEEAETELEQARTELEQAETELVQGLEQMQALGAPDAELAQTETQLAEVETQLAEVEAELEQVHERLTTLDEESEELELAAELTGFADEIRTVSPDGDVARATVVFTEDVFSLPEEVKQSVMDRLDGADIELSLIHI